MTKQGKENVGQGVGVESFSYSWVVLVSPARSQGPISYAHLKFLRAQLTDQVHRNLQMQTNQQHPCAGVPLLSQGGVFFARIPPKSSNPVVLRPSFKARCSWERWACCLLFCSPNVVPRQAVWHQLGAGEKCRLADPDPKSKSAF